jgi:prefoldin subunit 5
MAEFEQQARELTEFIGNVLTPRLRDIEALISDVKEEEEAYSHLADEMSRLRAEMTQPSTLLGKEGGEVFLEDLGCEVQVQARFTKEAAENVYVHVGLGFHVPLSHSEGAKLATDRTRLLKRRLAMMERDRQQVLSDIEDATALVGQARQVNKGAI